MAGTSIPLHPKAKAQGFSARFVCLSGKALKGGLHPVRLQLIHNLRVKRYTTGEACTLRDWDPDAARMKPRTKGAAQVNRVLGEMEGRVASIVDALVVNGSLSLDAFEARFRDPKGSGEVSTYARTLEARLIAEGRFGYALTYRRAANALDRLTGGRPLKFSELNPRRLQDLERMLRDDGGTDGGVAAVMRVLRVVLRSAVREGLMALDHYPFETPFRSGYSVKGLRSPHRSRAMSDEDLGRMRAFPFDKAPHLATSVRAFLFSYYASGMNFRDLARLTRENIQGDRLVFTRGKTGVPVDLLLLPAQRAILDEVAGHGGPYLFPFLGAEHVTEAQQWNRLRKCLRKLNADLKEAARVVDVRSNLTTYVARHTSATKQQREGSAIDTIARNMGHAHITITPNYLTRNDREASDRATLALLK